MIQRPSHFCPMEDSSQRLSWNSLLGRQICWEHHALVAPLDNPCFLSFSFHWYYVFLTPSQHLLPREPGLYQTAVYSVHHTMGHPFGLDSAAMARRSFTSCSSMLQQAGWTCSLAHWQLDVGILSGARPGRLVWELKGHCGAPQCRACLHLQV